jgi:hypothetical protein
MKKLLIGLLVLGSMGSFASEFPTAEVRKVIYDCEAQSH